MSRLYSMGLGLVTQFSIISIVSRSLDAGTNNPMLTIFTIYIICVAVSFTEAILAFTIFVESTTIPLIYQTLAIDSEAIALANILLAIWLISIKLQSIFNLI